MPQQHSNLNQHATTVLPRQLGIVPQYPENQHLSPSADVCNTLPGTKLQNPSVIDPPEEGKLVRVGNMLQIVPER